MLYAIKQFLSSIFTLSEDKENEQQIIASITNGVSFRGTNLWTLIFAIFIASIGLNVNSPAVIIGAMLISPLMGPIMGIGLAVAIYDFDLLKRAAKNLSIAVVISVITSFLYFTISPLHTASSELLARTNPSAWDVLIAFLGGLAGIVAGTRNHKSNVIPGVAIATALMPPLCTAGFGLATGQWKFFLGAAYLFFINGFFICLATLLIVKRLKFSKKQFATAETEKKVTRFIITLATLTIVPSIYLTYRIVQQSIFEGNANQFVQSEFHFTKTQVVTKQYKYLGKNNRIELLVVGQPLGQSAIDSLKAKMPDYRLGNAELVIHQGLDAKQQIDFSAIKASVLEEVFKKDNNKDSTQTLQSDTLPNITAELKALYPTLQQYAITPGYFTHTADSIKKQDTLMLFVGRFTKGISSNERTRLSGWLRQRLHSDSVVIIAQ